MLGFPLAAVIAPPAAADQLAQAASTPSAKFAFTPLRITSSVLLPDSYVLVGTGFGNNRSNIAVTENGVTLPPAAILSLTDQTIVVRSATTGQIRITIRRFGPPASVSASYVRPPPAPVIAAVAPTAQGYVIAGSHFGNDRNRVSVAEDARILPGASIVALADSRIEVRSAPTSDVSVRVQIGNLVSNAIRLAVPPPAIAAISRSDQGYVIAGTGFGTDRNRLAITEDARAVPSASIVTLTNNRIDVRSAPTGDVSIRVAIAGKVSNAVQLLAPPPTIAAISRSDLGYVIVGTGFGTDRSRLSIAEDARVVPTASIVTLTNNRIDVRSTPTSDVAIRVSVAGKTSNAVQFLVPPPTIAAISRTDQGYVIAGTGFGTDRTRFAVTEDARAVPSASIVTLTNNRIDVRSVPTSDVSIRVTVAGKTSNAVQLLAPPPTVVLAARPDYSYALVGSGFGSDRSRTTVVENGVALPASAILTLTDSRIEVRSTSTGGAMVVVRVGTRVSAPIQIPAALGGRTP